MLVTAMVACEVGFWVLIGAGLLVRYGFGRRRLGGVLLAGAPVVDLVLLALTVADLQGGGRAQAAHGLAAVYLGFSVVFGHALVRRADERFAHRFANGPRPAAKPPSGTWPRVRLEWREFGLGVLAAGISAALLLGAIALIGDDARTAALDAWFPRLTVALGLWLVGWPVWETLRTAGATRHP